MNKILITGGGGLLGYALKQFLPDAIYLTSKDYDLTDICRVREMFEDHSPQKVIHLAARVGGVKRNAAQNADLFKENIQINTNVLSMAAEYKVSRLISCLSSCCYQYYDDRFSTEDDLHLGLPFGGNLGYGCAKRMLDIHTSLLNEQYGCSFTTITPATMYGPNDNWDLEDGHVVGSLIHKCFLAKERNVPLVVWGSGNAVRQFVFSYDIARVTIEALDVDWGPKTMIVAPDHGSSIGELALKIAKATGFKGKLVFDSTKPEGARARVLESKLFRKYFPKFSFTPLDEGLTMAAEWFLRHFKNELLSDKHHASVSL